MTSNPFSSDYKGSPPAATKPVTPEAEPAERKVLITKPGFYPDITPAQYFAEPAPEPALTNSLIKLLAPEGAAPAKAAYHHPAIGQPPEERKATAAQYMGSLVHRLALDKGDDYAISPYATYQSNDAKAWKADVEKRGVVPVKQAEFDEAQAMANIVKDRLLDTFQGFPYTTETVIAWQEEVELIGGGHFTIWARAMVDAWCEDLMLAVDVKTCRDASDVALNKAFYNDHARTDAWYLRGLNAVTGQPGVPRYGFMLVESDAPYLHREAHSTESFRHGARIDCERAMRVFATCLARGEWPGYAPYSAYPSSWQLTAYTTLEAAEISVNGV